MPRLDSSSSFSGVKTGSVAAEKRAKSQQLACDRCRGQKLRCIRGSNHKIPCERCQKAGATCIIDSGVRMGRPRRSDKEQPGGSSGGSRNAYQPTPSPTLPTSSSQATNSVDFAISTGSWSVHDLDDVPADPALHNNTVQYLDTFDFSLAEEGTIEEGSVGIPREHYLSQHLGLSSGSSITTLVGTQSAAVDTTEALNDLSQFSYRRLPPMHQEIMQEFSDLNMQLCRQLGAINPTVNNFTSILPGLSLTAFASPPGENRTLCDTVVFMMHSLQTYYRLLVELLGPTDPIQPATYDENDSRKSSTMTTVPPSMLSSLEGSESEDSMKLMSEATSRPSSKRQRSDGNAEFMEYMELRDLSPKTKLDIPTCLLLLSCHTNLMHVCRNAFLAIRTALPTINRHIDLFTISFLDMVDLAMPPEPELQIIVLIQTVVRMIDRIGRLLGYPNDCENDSNGERSEGTAGSSAIPQRLLDLVMRGEACGEDSADIVGIKELRTEIRKLHDLVYKAV